MLNIVGRKKIWFTISGILVAVAVLAMILYGFKQSPEFAGGSQWEFNVAGNQPTLTQVQTFFANNLQVQGAEVTYDSTNQSFLASFNTIDEATHQQYLTLAKDQWPGFNELSFSSIGPSVGAALEKDSIIAIILVIIGISLYIAFAFRKASRPVSSWKYGWITLLTLFHDVSIPAGLLAILGHFKGIEIDSDFIVALLVVMGFSVHDTIVVFDRIRENLVTHRGKAGFADIVNESINQTLARSVNTSLTLILVLLALLFAGPADLWYFVLTLLVGVTTGIYSSIFIASPALVLLKPKGEK
ncbi:MAG TPA: protein translocase subunit SecF [Candidatus Paceibacterota bacterium]|jgi:preprotein translocase subunit SecF|nr:protein translocase subunit SecF [Candidatus Paceibacterota bacterium]